MKTKVDDLTKIIDKARESAVDNCRSMASKLLNEIKAMDGYQSVDQQIRSEIDKSFEDLENNLNNTVVVDLVAYCFRTL